MELGDLPVRVAASFTLRKAVMSGEGRYRQGTRWKVPATPFRQVPRQPSGTHRYISVSFHSRSKDTSESISASFRETFGLTMRDYCDTFRKGPRKGFREGGDTRGTQWIRSADGKQLPCLSCPRRHLPLAPGRADILFESKEKLRVFEKVLRITPSLTIRQ